MSDTAAIVLAAGKSTRMKSELPKVLHEICGRPMLGYVLNACRLAGVDRLLAVVGHRKDDVIEAFRQDRDIEWVEQREQKGTGHAVKCCVDVLRGFEGQVLIIAGDMPLVRRETIASLFEVLDGSDDAGTIATTVLDDPAGYGRIVRDEHERLVGIVEHADCTAEQLKIHEVNPSYYCFRAEALFSALERVVPQGPKGEYYLTQVVDILRKDGRVVSAVVRAPAEDAMGINSRTDLAVVSRVMQDRLQQTLLDDGVTIVDPDNTWIEADATVGRDTTIQPFSFVGVGATIGEGCRIGPFAHIEPGTEIPSGTNVTMNAGVGREAGGR